jgi:hypothetical protein
MDKICWTVMVPQLSTRGPRFSCPSGRRRCEVALNDLKVSIVPANWIERLIQNVARTALIGVNIGGGVSTAVAHVASAQR